MAANTPFMPNGMNPPPPGLKLPAWKWKNRMMMVRTGMATFHHVMALLTRANSRTARKLIAVKMAIRMTVQKKPQPVVTRVVGLYRLGQ